MTILISLNVWFDWKVHLWMRDFIKAQCWNMLFVCCLHRCLIDCRWMYAQWSVYAQRDHFIDKMQNAKCKRNCFWILMLFRVFTIFLCSFFQDFIWCLGIYFKTVFDFFGFISGHFSIFLDLFQDIIWFFREFSQDIIWFFYDFFRTFFNFYDFFHDIFQFLWIF